MKGKPSRAVRLTSWTLHRSRPPLNIDFKLKDAEPLMTAGQTVAEAQMEVQPWQPVQKREPVVKDKIKVTDKITENLIRFSGNGFSITFNRKTGFLTSYQVDGHDLLGEGGTLKPNFWRARTDFPYGATPH